MRDILNKSQLNIKTIDRYDQDVIPTHKLHAILGVLPVTNEKCVGSIPWRSSGTILKNAWVKFPGYLMGLSLRQVSGIKFFNQMSSAQGDSIYHSCIEY